MKASIKTNFGLVASVLSLLFTLHSFGQNIEVTHQANGTVISVPVESIDSVVFQLVPPPELKIIYQSNGNILSISMNDVDSITYIIPNVSLLPQVSTGAATTLSSSSGFVSGNVLADGGSNVTQRGFCWSLSPNPTIANNTSQNGTGLGSFNHTIQPLSPSTTYYIRAYATNSEGTAYGNQVTLTTSAANTNANVPTIQTELIVYNDGLTAISGGNITADGGLAVTSRGVCWAIGTTPTINNSISNDGSGAGSFQSTLTGLQPGTSYFVRAYATNDAGTAYGITYSFTTNSLPVVQFLSLNLFDINAISASAQVTSDNGSNVFSRGFYWSTNPNPSINDFSSSNGSGQGTFSNTINNLQPSTTYFFRAYAQNNVGIVYSSILSITTLSCLSTPTVVVDVVNPLTGAVWMDRNLGAFNSASNVYDLYGFGDLYQWGRGADGHQCRTSFTTVILSSSDLPGHDYFILTNNFPNDWRSPQNLTLWQGINGVNNPCPIGYRLPTQAEFNSEVQSWSIYDINGFASPLKLAWAGLREWSGNGQISNVGVNGYYWTSSFNDDPWNNANSRRLRLGFDWFFGHYNEISDAQRAYGLSVRCIKD